MMKQKLSTIRFAPNLSLALVIALLAVSFAGGFACSDEQAVENSGENSEVTDTGTDASDTGSDTSDTDDSDVEEDVDTGPGDFCEEVGCEDGEECYHGACYDSCDSVLDCSDGERCDLGRCAVDHCDDMECNDGYSCYRGACYENCVGSADCGIGGGITCVEGGCVPVDQQCEGIECDQVTCPDGGTTSVTGTVTIPSGDYPLNKVTVYVPTTELDPLPEGATCATCGELLSGDPLMLNLTDVEGRFELPNFPVTDEVPLVIQTGKWRREVTVTDIEPCVENELDDELTRLPRNQEEGNIPKIAVAAGGCDNLECLVRNIGLDESEFTTMDGDGAVHLYSGIGGSSSFQSGEQFEEAESLWEDGTKIAEYDMFLDSCECSDYRTNKSDIALMNFEYFLSQGGRAFLSHYQYVWLRDSGTQIGELAEWNPSLSTSGEYVEVRDTHEEGEQMHDWLEYVGALNASGQMTITQPRNSILELNDEFTKEWLYYPIHSIFDEETPNYFSFNMPLGTEGDNSCGRAVFADLHVSSGSASAFPSSCSGEEISPQEMALFYMLFDLSACIAPECEPLDCETVKGQCGVHANQCGGIVECGECCSETDELCSDDSHCCGDLTCDVDAGRCGG